LRSRWRFLWRVQPFSHSTITTIDACNVPVISARNCSHTHTHTHTHTNTTATVSRENCGCDSRAARDLSDRQHHGDSYRPNRSLFKDTRTNDHSYRLATTSLYTRRPNAVCCLLSVGRQTLHTEILAETVRNISSDRNVCTSQRPSVHVLRSLRDASATCIRYRYGLRIVIHFSCSILQQSSCVFFRILWHKTWINKYAKSSVELEKVP